MISVHWKETDRGTYVFYVRSVLLVERYPRVLLIYHLENPEILQQCSDLRHCSFRVLDHPLEECLEFCRAGIPEGFFGITEASVEAKAMAGEESQLQRTPSHPVAAQARRVTYCCHLLRMCVILLLVGLAYGLP